MDREEKDIFDFMNKLSEEESIILLEGFDVDQYQLNEEQTERIQNKVFAQISNTTSITSEASGIRKSWFSSKELLLAAGIIVILIIGAFTPVGHNALADIIKKIYYLPGAGAVEEGKQDSIFVLSKGIRIKYDGGEIRVHSIIKNKQGMTVKMSGDTESDSKGNSLDKHALLADNNAISKLAVVDEKGVKYTSGNSSYALGNGWVGMYYFNNLPEDFNKFKIIVSDDMQIPIDLKKAEGYNDYRSIGPTDIKNSLGLTIAPFQDEQKIRFELIEHPFLNRNVDLYGYEDPDGYGHIDVTVKDSNGGVYPVEHLQSYMGVLSEFYFKASNKYKSYTVEIPEVRMHYKADEEIHLDIPESGEVKINKILSMDGFQFRIDKIMRQSNKVRVYVDNYYNENKPENLSRFNFYIESDGKRQARSYSWKYDNNIIARYYEFDIAPDENEIQMKFTDLYTILKGPWKFILK